jgi:D-alanyl-D-alanine carboxypeptidase/D-alanyl-D-alanine-endopeptidase (penicillin-binding protein 4)
MFKILFSSLMVGFLGIFQQESINLEPTQPLAWQEATIFNLPVESDPQIAKLIENYLQSITQTGLPRNQQGIWIQDWAVLGEHQGKIALSAASLTKIATTLASLDKWGANHRFETKIYTTGAIASGILQGDLIIQAGGDPLLVWEEAITIGNTLKQLDIKKIQGNLIIIGDLYFNFKEDQTITSRQFLQALNQRLWSSEITKQYQTLAPGTPRPEITISGTIIRQNQLPENAKLLITHQSLSLAEILKQMNIYSNNSMSEILAKGVGGHQTVASKSVEIAQLSPDEINLINGSGLGVENRISPRASCNMLTQIERLLQDHPLTVMDLFPLAGRDTQGTMQFRNIPWGIAIKTGTLRQVSALAGIIPTQERGAVCFAIINNGGTNIEQLRRQQDQFLQRLDQHWQINSIEELTPKTAPEKIGDPTRNIIAN